MSELELKFLDILGEHFLGLDEPEIGLPLFTSSNTELNPLPSREVKEPHPSMSRDIGLETEFPSPEGLTGAKRKRLPEKALPSKKISYLHHLNPPPSREVKEPQPSTSRNIGLETEFPSSEVPTWERKRLPEKATPSKKIPYLDEYKDTLAELKGITNVIKNSLEGISHDLKDMTAEMRRLNSNLEQVKYFRISSWSSI